MFIYGTQYLRGFTPEKDQWEKDMESMKQCGFNTIRAWLVWNAIERSEGNIDYQYISDFLTCAKNYGFNVGLLFHMHACPAWAVKKFSKYFYMNEKNLPFEPAVRANTPSGGWPGLCFDNEEVREIEHRFISGVIAETKKYDNVAFYEPMNEPHQWINYQGEYIPSEMFCYCPATTGKFQRWLERKYNDVEVLNKAWGHFYNSFDEVRAPRWGTSFSDYADFRLFTMDNLVEELRFRTDIIKENDNKPVIGHAWGGGSTIAVHLGQMAMDDWKNAEVFEKWGFSAFPKFSRECYMLGLGSDSARSAANGKDYWQSELSAGEVGNIFEQRGRIDDKTFDKFALESIRHGAKGLLYWQYRRERIGSEFGGYAMTDFNGGPTTLTKKATELGRFLSKHGDVWCNGKMKQAEVAIVFSIRSYMADWLRTEKFSNKHAVDCMSGYYKMFWEENITVDIIHEAFADNLSQYKVIILPLATAIAPELVEKLKEYVRNGGTLISEQTFGIFENTFKLSYNVPGYGFDEIFGVNENELKPRETVTISDGKNKYTLTGNKYVESFKNVTADTLYEYEDGTPAIVSKKYGRGTAILSGVNLGLTYSGRELISDDFKSRDAANISVASKYIIMKICEELNVAGNICSEKEVKVSISETDSEAVVILINSTDTYKKGYIILDKQYNQVETVYGESDTRVDGKKVFFTLREDCCAALRLK